MPPPDEGVDGADAGALGALLAGALLEEELLEDELLDELDSLLLSDLLPAGLW